MPVIKFDTASKMYYIEYYDIKTGKRKRPRISRRKDIATKKANDVLKEMMDAYMGINQLEFSDIDLEELEKLYFQSITGRLAPSTIRRYRSFADNYIKFLKVNFPTVKSATDVKDIYIEEFLSQCQKAGVKPKTLNNQLFHIKTLYRFAIKKGFIQSSPIESIARFRDPKQYRKPEFWTRGEIKDILNAVRLEWRNQFEFLYVTGLRIGEMINLSWEDVNIASTMPTMTIQSKGDWEAKTKGIKVIPLNKRAIELIRVQTHSPNHDKIFKGPRGGKIKYDDMHHRLDEALQKLGLNGHLHKFRHSFASHLSEEGKSLQSIKELLGHKNIEQTIVYAQLGEEHLRDVSDSLLED